MKLLSLFLLLVCISCGEEKTSENAKNDESTFENNLAQASRQDYLNTSGETINARFKTPEDFERISYSEDSFGHYLRNLPLKSHGSSVKLYDGSTKANIDIYEAVVDMKIGHKDLHQCADAVMRFRAEFLWNEKRYDEIHFNFTNGFRVDYSEWMKGKRLRISGNSVSWVNSQSPSNTYTDFWNYMEMIFSYAGTLSLSRELKSIPLQDMQIGDVFIRGGSPGHAVLVVDMAEAKSSGEQVFLLAQSYMPAQETQVLKNPNNDYSSPWYTLTDINTKLYTPEWTFDDNELMRFKD